MKRLSFGLINLQNVRKTMNNCYSLIEIYGTQLNKNHSKNSILNKIPVAAVSTSEDHPENKWTSITECHYYNYRRNSSESCKCFTQR